MPATQAGLRQDLHINKAAPFPLTPKVTGVVCFGIGREQPLPFGSLSLIGCTVDCVDGIE